MIQHPVYFFKLLEGFRLGVFPGVFLLSRCRRSGFPVESAILFGLGFKSPNEVFAQKLDENCHVAFMS